MNAKKMLTVLLLAVLALLPVLVFGSAAPAMAAEVRSDGVITPPPVPLPDVTITLTPINAPIFIPAKGGTYQYDVQVTNNSDLEQRIEVWMTLEGPDGIARTSGPVALTLLPGHSAAHVLAHQQVPAAAPAGTYTHSAFIVAPCTILRCIQVAPCAQAELCDGGVIDSDSFTWTKVGVYESVIPAAGT